jgi:L-asparaginase
MRGNRAWKSNTEIFNAIESPNFPSLAQIGTHIFFEHELLLRPKQEKIFHADMVEGVGVLKLYPGILASSIEYALSRPNMKVCIIESFGAGNVPSDAVFLEVFKSAIERGVSIVNISQCKKGRVDSSLYKTGQKFEETGAVFAADLTFEAAITKSMYLLSLGYSGEKFKTKLLEPIAGELTP